MCNHLYLRHVINNRFRTLPPRLGKGSIGVFFSTNFPMMEEKGHLRTLVLLPSPSFGFQPHTFKTREASRILYVDTTIWASIMCVSYSLVQWASQVTREGEDYGPQAC